MSELCFSLFFFNLFSVVFFDLSGSVQRQQKFHNTEGKSGVGHSPGCWNTPSSLRRRRNLKRHLLSSFQSAAGAKPENYKIIGSAWACTSLYFCFSCILLLHILVSVLSFFFAPVWHASLSVCNILFSCLSTLFLFPDYRSSHGCIYRPGHLPRYCWCSI